MGRHDTTGKLHGLMLALLLILLMIPLRVARADETIATGDVGLGGKGTLTILLDYTDEDRVKQLDGGWVGIYLVGVASIDEATGLGYFETRGASDKIVLSKSVALDEIRKFRTDAELEVHNAEYADVLAAEAKSNKLPFLCDPLQIRDGQVRFTGMSEGLYLVIQTQYSPSDHSFSPYLVSMPCLNEYDIVAEPKTDKNFEEKNVHIYAPIVARPHNGRQVDRR